MFTNFNNSELTGQKASVFFFFVACCLVFCLIFFLFQYFSQLLSCRFKLIRAHQILLSLLWSQKGFS